MSKVLCPLYCAKKRAPKALFIDGDEPFTYEAFDAYVDQIALAIGGHPKSSVFATTSQNSIFSIALLMACLRRGFVFFPLSPKLPRYEHEKQLKESGAVHCFSDPIPFSLYKREELPFYIEEESQATYLLTSGSTSHPKICAHSYRNHFYSALGSNERLNYTKNDRWLLSLPLYHISGLSLVFRTLLAQATLVISSKEIGDALKSDKISHLSVVPTQLQRLINNETLPSLKGILLGGAPIPKFLLEEGVKKNLPIYPTYGLTEMSSQVATYCPISKKMKLLPYREVKISKEEEVLVRGETLFLGYIENGKVIRPLDSSGYFATKDRALYEQDHFTYLGRLDHLFISGGENIQPEEIERVLISHEEILEAVVLPIEDQEFGQRPVALIKTKRTLLQKELNDYLLKVLPKFKIPIHYYGLSYSGFKPPRKELSFRLKEKQLKALI